MATIFPHLGTVLASRALSLIPLSAMPHAAAESAGTTALVTVILIGAFLGSVGQAMRALAALAAAFLQVVAAVTALLVVTAILTVVTLVLPGHP